VVVKVKLKSRYAGKEYNQLKNIDDTKELEGVEVIIDDGNLELTEEMIEKIESGEAIIGKVDKEQLEVVEKKIFNDEKLNKRYIK
jgi:hypothetical protein